MDNGQINWEEEIKNISKWMKEYLEKSGAKGYVVGLSGGIDSSIVSYLAVKAVGEKNVIGVSLTCETRSDMKLDAEVLSKNLGINFKVINLEKTYNSIIETLIDSGEEVTNLTKQNIKSRLRMVFLYSIANQNNFLVAGTGNLSEDKIGYFTKFGDGGIDNLPIGNYYKTEIYKMANLIPEIPNCIKEKAPSADLSPDQTDEKDIGMNYSEIDNILINIEKSTENSLDQEKVYKIKSMIRKSEHKNNYPPKYDRTL